MATTPPVTIPYGTSGSNLTSFLGGKGLGTDNASISKLWSGAFGSFGTTYSGTAAQNAALLHAVQTGYKGNVDNKTISGSSSVKQGMNTTAALNSASSSIGGGNGSSSSVSTAPPPPLTSTTPITSSNPTISSYQSATKTAIDQAHQDASVAIQPVTDTFNTNYQLLQNQKQNALAAAKATYAAANPNGFGSDQDEYMSSVASAYDAQINNLSKQYADSVQQNSQSLQDNINTINATYQQNVMAYQKDQLQNLQWTIANDPPQPLNTKEIKSESDLKSALMTWGAQNQTLVDTAFSTGQYGDENNMQDYYSVVAMLAHPSKASIEEQTSQERIGIESGMLGVAQQNANTTQGNAGATTTTTAPNFFTGLLNTFTGVPSTRTTKKTPAGADSSSFDPSSLF